MKSHGAAHVIGIDRVNRAEFAGDFGVDELATDESRNWAAGVEDGAAPDLVIDAVGHQQGVLDDAVTALAFGGHLFVFGLPEDRYILPMRTFFRKGLTMNAGTTRDWPRFLALGQEYLLAHRDLAKRYFTHVFGTDQAQEAFETAVRLSPTRMKVGLRNPGSVRP
jgi:threonine dehydrogenase-like Zn-dependent dehydrogenase